MLSQALTTTLLALYALPPSVSARGDWTSWGGGKPVLVKAGQSIQAAISSARPGAKIIVSAGTYSEQLLITQNGIKLIGLPGATLTPPATPIPNICSGLSGGADEAGICISGTDVVLLDFIAEHRRVSTVGTRVQDVSVSGFTIKGFTGENIAIVGAQNTKITGNTLLDGGSYGCLSDGSIDSTISGNVVSRSGELGFISICVDDVSGARVSKNKVDNTFVGLCVQTSGADIGYNDVSKTCNGAFIDPNIADAKVHDNHFYDSNVVCNNATINPVGVYGVIAAGSVGANIKNNHIEGISSGGLQAPFAAGIAVVDDPTKTPPVLARDTKVKGNVLGGNDVDILLFSNGTGNVVQGNTCGVSVPPGLCGS